MDLSNYDFVVDTTSATPDEVADAIIAAYRAWQMNPSLCIAAISPDRLAYPDDEPDAEKLMEYSDALEQGGVIPAVSVFEEDGDFCVVSEVEAALAHALSMKTFIPVRLVPGYKDGREFVKMKNSL